MDSFSFEIIHNSKKSNARAGKIYTSHGVIETPCFVGVGTNGSIKALDNKMVAKIGLQLMFCNTYHLLLQPGYEVMKKIGGLHSFINRDLPIITDSGGFQVFSLKYGGVSEELKGKGKKINKSSVIKITEEGILFRSYRDGKKILLTPESSVEFQKILKADIIIPLDELPPYHRDKKELEKSLERTHRWEKRSLEYHLKNKNNQAMYGVIHGGIDKDLRKKSTKYLSSFAFDGFAIGGSVGKDQKEMLDVLQYVKGDLSKKYPIHLLGIGDISSIEKAIPFGIDTFDSSYPTKAARHGFLFYKKRGIKILKKEYSMDQGPIDKDCCCYTCRHYKRAYIHHLFKAKELTGYFLATVHNLHFMVQLMKNFRKKILKDEI